MAAIDLRETKWTAKKDSIGELNCLRDLDKQADAVPLDLSLELQLKMLNSARSQVSIERDNPGYSRQGHCSSGGIPDTLRLYLVLLSVNESAKLKYPSFHAAITWFYEVSLKYCETLVTNQTGPVIAKYNGFVTIGKELR